MTPYLQKRSLYAPLITNRPSLVLGMIVVIPCYDEPEVLRTLLSLQKCTTPTCDVEVIIVINDSEKDNAATKQRNLETYRQLRTWNQKQLSTKLKFHILRVTDLPKKQAGVGLARKIGMDEAVWRFEKVGNKKGIIVCFDADSKCKKNYLVEIELFFEHNDHLQAATIHFEHPLIGFEFDDEVYESILLYELHLRYIIHLQAWAGHPFAYQTIGSSMAVVSDAYQQQGGMNRKKAGEDFYFLQKFIELGKVDRLTKTTVIPSPRVSHRVPFGTGKAVGEISKNTSQYTTYAFESYQDLKMFFSKIEDFYSSTVSLDELYISLPKSIQTLLELNMWKEKIEELKRNTSTFDAFENRFYRWFNAFQVIKYLHHARDHFYPNVSIPKAVEILNNIYQVDYNSPKEMLLFLRKEDKKM